MNRRANVSLKSSFFVFVVLIFGLHAPSFSCDQAAEKQILDYLEQIRIKTVAVHTNVQSFMPLKGHAVAIAQLFLPQKKGE